MRTGARNVVVSIYTRSETVDPNYNTPNYSNTLWKQNVFCRMTPRRGREQVVDGQIVSETYYRIEFDYLDVDGISERMVIIHNGISYDISSIMRDETTKDTIVVDASVEVPGTARA